MTQTYPMTITLSAGAPLVLTRYEPKDSELAFADEIGRAVESAAQQVGGDGERAPHWKKFDTWLPTPGSFPLGRGLALGAFEDALRYAVRAEIDGLIYPITRIRVVSRSPYPGGYRLGMQMIGPYPDFQRVGIEGGILGPAPLW